MNCYRKRLENLVTDPYPSAKALIDKISVQINNHSIGQEQFDDITILALRRRSAINSE